MKKIRIVISFLVIVFVVIIHIGIFLTYDHLYNSGNNITKIKKKIQNYSEMDRRVQIQSNEKRIRKKYIQEKDPVQSSKSRIYSWVDSSGVKHFSDMRPNEAVSNLKISEMSISDDLGESERIAQKIDRYPSNSPITRAVIKDNRVFVPVRLGYEGQEVQVMLLLDTGASTTVIHREAGSKLNLWDRLKTTSIVADGRNINTELAYLDYIQVGPHRLRNFKVSIIDYSGDNDHYTGLLGMNFIRRIEYTINYAKQTIRWR